MLFRYHRGDKIRIKKRILADFVTPPTWYGFNALASLSVLGTPLTVRNSYYDLSAGEYYECNEYYVHPADIEAVSEA